MADPVDKILGISTATAGIVSYLFYRFYKSRSEKADQVKDIPVWQADLELYDHLNILDKNCLAYAAVEGVVTDLGRTITSHHGDATGVIRQTRLVEHSSKRINGFWSDTKKEIGGTTSSVPFALTKSESGDPKFNIEVLEASDAQQLESDLQVTYDKFEPSKTSLFQVGMDRLFGDVTKGIQETEKMLMTGTGLLGVGKVFLDRDRIRIGPPDDPSRSYILTTMSLSQLIKSYRSQSKTFKIVSLVFAAVGGTLLAALVWRHLRGWLEKRRQRREFEEIRRAVRDSHQARNQGEGDNVAQRDACVVCLEEERQVVALNCGHIALCTNCAELLPSPKTCPVCRALVVRFSPIFIS